MFSDKCKIFFLLKVASQKMENLQGPVELHP